MDQNLRRITELASEKKELLSRIETEYEKVIVGQKSVFKSLMTGLLCEGHILVEGLPGLAKTLAVQTLSHILGLDFHRIQFTPDMLPADIRGTMIYNQSSGRFEVKKGPIFTNFVLADEINRAPSKVQAALLESMQERTVSLGDTTYQLERPFVVMATQNPIEQEGTYVLPEAQTDRFLLKVLVSYPTRAEERRIISRMGGALQPEANTIMTRDQVLELQDFVKQIYADEKIMEYIVNLVFATREPANIKIRPEYLRYGASPRASLAFLKAAKAEAFFDGRAYVIPEDVKAVAYEVLRHRISLTFEAEAEGITPDTIVRQILQRVEIP
ncbi:MAG: AAA family ATPase [Brevinema sp.]